MIFAFVIFDTITDVQNDPNRKCFDAYTQITKDEHVPYIYEDGSVTFYVLDYDSELSDEGDLLYHFLYWDGEKNVMEKNFVINGSNIVKKSEYKCNRFTISSDGTKTLYIYKKQGII